MRVINNSTQPRRLFLYSVYKQELMLPGNADTFSHHTPHMSNVYRGHRENVEDDSTELPALPL